MVRLLRTVTGMALSGSGGLMIAASAQRWGDVCGPGQGHSEECALRQDHLYDFLLSGEPWQPVGHAAELAGLSLMVLAVALPVLPRALTLHRPGLGTAVTSWVASVAVAAVGLATLRSGLAGVVVKPTYDALTTWTWLLAPPLLFGMLIAGSRGWARATACLLLVSAPLVAFFSYAIGSYDANPWWEAVSGGLMVLSGLGLVAATRSSRRVAPPLAAESTAEASDEIRVRTAPG